MEGETESTISKPDSHPDSTSADEEKILQNGSVEQTTEQGSSINDTSLADPETGPAPQVGNVGSEVLPESQSDRVARHRHGNMDNLRAVLIIFLILQHAALETVSTAHNSAQLQEDSPKAFECLTLFVAFTRTVVISMLFFISGFSSLYTRILESTSALDFLGRKTWRTALAGLGYHLSITVIQRFYGPWPETGPYYSTKAGKDAILRGPIFYVTFRLLLDYLFILFMLAHRAIWGKKTQPIINTRGRYLWASIAMYGVLECIMFARAENVVRFPDSVKKWLYLANSAELHAPFLYILSYVGGIQFIRYHKITFKLFPAQGWLGLFFYFLLTFLALRTMYEDLPNSIPQYLDLRVAPPLVFSDGDAKHFGAKYFVFWTTIVTFILPPTIVGSFYTLPALKRKFGIVSRSAFLQTYIHMMFVIGFARGAAWIENLLWRAVYVGAASIVCGWLTVLVPVMLFRSIKARWNERINYQRVSESDKEEV